MAIEPHTPSRRALLGALSAGAIGVPLAAVPIVAAAQTPDTAAWDTALTLYEAAWRACEEHNRAIWQPASARVDAAIAAAGLSFPGSSHAEVAARHAVELDACPDWDRINDQSDVLAERAADALDELIETPAPNMRALLEKIEIIFARTSRACCPEWGGALLADARRLLGGEA